MCCKLESTKQTAHSQLASAAVYTGAGPSPLPICPCHFLKTLHYVIKRTIKHVSIFHTFWQMHFNGRNFTSIAFPADHLYTVHWNSGGNEELDKSSLKALRGETGRLNLSILILFLQWNSSETLLPIRVIWSWKHYWLSSFYVSFSLFSEFPGISSQINYLNLNVFLRVPYKNHWRVDGRRETTVIKRLHSPELSTDWKVLGEGLGPSNYVTLVSIISLPNPENKHVFSQKDLWQPSRIIMGLWHQVRFMAELAFISSSRPSTWILA